MKKGDYLVHVLVEAVKKCEGEAPKPRVKIVCLGKTERTEEAPSCSDYTFNEHFYFEKNNMTKEMLDSEKIILEVYDTKNTKRENYLGILEFDFSFIYGKEGHALQNYWIALANPESKDIGKIRGYLKVSISVLHEDDPRIELEMKEGQDNECFLPAAVKMKYKQLTINIFRAENVPDMDTFVGSEKKGSKAECDGFVEVKYSGLTYKTQVVSMKDQKIRWNECIKIPLSTSSFSQKIVMLIKDHDVKSDDLVGSIEVPIDDILKGEFNQIKFLQIYGSYVNTNSPEANMMNTNAEIGSRWKGRLFLQITAVDDDKPISGVFPISDEKLKAEAENCGARIPWALLFKIYQSYYFPLKEKYVLRIEWAGAPPVFSKEINAQSTRIDWNFSKKINASTASEDAAKIPDVFIYLTDQKNTKVYCFNRLRCADILNNNKILTLKLIPEKSGYPNMTLMESGILNIKIGAFCCSNNRKTYNEADFGIEGADQVRDLEDEMDDDFQAQNTKTEEPKNFTAVVAVYMSKGLLPADSNGKSDPYVQIDWDDRPQKTEVKKSTVNGIWNEKLVLYNLPFVENDKSTWPILRVRVIDHNDVFTNKDMGYCYLWLASNPYPINDFTTGTPHTPKWFDLYLPKSNKKQGKLLMSLYIFSEENNHLASQIVIMPETKTYSCEFNLLGLRELKPLSLIPVKKPYIKFELKSLNCIGDKEEIQQAIITTPGDTGPNPTINTVFKFDVDLPTEPEFIPELQCEVYDNLLSGMVKSLLGVFTLDLSQIIKITELRINEDLKEIEDYMKESLVKGVLGRSMPELNLFSSEKENQKEGEIEIQKEKPKAMQMTEVKGDSKEPLIDESQSEQSKEGMQETNPNSSLEIKPSEEVLVEESIPISKLTEEEYKRMLIDSKYFVVYPVPKFYEINPHLKEKYKIKDFYIEDLKEAPKSTDFMAVGYLLKIDNPKYIRQTTTKHYRRIFGQPLENNKFLFRQTFHEENLRRENFTDTTNETILFDLLVPKVDEKTKQVIENMQILNVYGDDLKPKIEWDINTKKKKMQEKMEEKRKEKEGSDAIKTKSFGKFKALLRIAEVNVMRNYLEKMEKYINNPKFEGKMKFYRRHQELCEKMHLRSQINCRVYILKMNLIANLDKGSENDPYIKIYLGDKLIFNESDNYVEDNNHPEWNKCYDIPCEMPGSGALRIECWDYDPFISDDFIGQTVIDLEDRFFCQRWQALENKPIEVRPLIHPDRKGEQGDISLWLEMFDLKEKEQRKKKWCIETEPKQKFVVEVDVWGTEEMETFDVEGTSDIYIYGFFDPKKKQSTDVHYRCQSGNASFNWRMLFDYETPPSTKNYDFYLQVFDKDIFSSDDYMCQAKMNIENIINFPKYSDIPIKFTKEYYEKLSPEEKKRIGEIEFESSSEDAEGIKFWITCYDVKGTKNGRILLSMQIKPESKAVLMKKGLGREEPNVDPYLPPPVGRFEFTLNPYKLVNQLVGPKFRRKCYCILCGCFCLVYICALIPYVIYHISAEGKINIYLIFFSC
ncbi:MAG: hypothetical protein MJ252_10295 [archaeon]|nr:hypothetical protein [archaeon]